MIGKNLKMYLLATILFMAISGGMTMTSLAQVKNDVGQSKINEEGSNRKNLTICYSFDETGRIEKIGLRPRASDSQPVFPRLMTYQETLTTVDEILPFAERGPKVSESNVNVGRLNIETLIFEKFQIDLSHTCRYSVCGISYAEIRRRYPSR